MAKTLIRKLGRLVMVLLMLHVPQAKTEGIKDKFTCRIHLVRHAETEANHAGIVLGQIDSPLTALGIQQAKAANGKFGQESYWRMFSSDLKRCILTAKLIVLGMNDDDAAAAEDVENNDTIVLDERLRERAKGVREGQSKHLTYDEAMELYQEQKRKEGVDFSERDLPLLENEEEVMQRVQDWIEEVLGEAYDHHCKVGGHGNYDILAITHSGTLRIVLEKLVGKQLPHDVKREDRDKDGVQVGRLVIPNTSKSILEFTMSASSCASTDDNTCALVTTTCSVDGKDDKWSVKLVELTNVSHIEGIE